MRILARDVLEFVAADHGLSLTVMLSARRTRDLARPRQVAMYVMRTVCPHLSYPEIGRRMGGRDHTTILHGVRKIEELMSISPEIAHAVTRAVRHFEAIQAQEALIPDPALIDHALHFRALCNSYGRAMGMAA